METVTTPGGLRPSGPSPDHTSPDDLHPAITGSSALLSPTKEDVARAFDILVRSVLGRNGLVPPCGRRYVLWSRYRGLLLRRPSSPCSDPQSIDNDIEIIRLSLLKMQEEGAIRTANLHKERNALASSALPVELCTRIFSECKNMDEDPLRRLLQLSRVSVRWWDIIRTTASLWTTVNPAYKDTQIALKLSKNSPLRVILDSSLDLYPLFSGERGHGQRYNCIRAEMQRWQSVSVKTADLARITDFLGPLPMLQSLDLCFDLSSIAFPFTGGPLLQHLRLWSLDIRSWSTVDLPRLETLEVRSIRVGSRWGVKLVESLVASPLLRRLGLLDIALFSDAANDPPSSPTQVIMPNLTALTLEDVASPVLCSLFECIRGPQLSRLHLHQRDLIHSSAILDAMDHTVDGPSLLLCAITNASLSEIRIQVSRRAIEIKHPDPSNTSLDFAINTLNPVDTMLHLAELFQSTPTHVPIRLHFTSANAILRDSGVTFLDTFSTLSEIAVTNFEDASVLLRYVLQATTALSRLETFGFEAGFKGDERDFIELTGLLKEMLHRRPRVTVWDWHMQPFEWGLESFSGRAIPPDVWLDGPSPL